MKRLVLTLSMAVLLIGIAYAAIHRSISTFYGTSGTFFHQASGGGAKTFQFDDAYQTNVWYAMSGPGQGVAVSVDVTGDTLNAQGHGFANTDRVYVTARTTATGLTQLVEYFVVSSTASSFKLSATSGGAAIDITAMGDQVVVHSITKRFIPFNVNTATGGTNASWSAVAPSFADANGNIASPSISVSLIGDATLTNTATFTFVRSADGVNYGLSAQDQFAFAITPTTAVLTTITNIPAVFLTGTKSIKPYRVVLAANTTAGTLGVTAVTINGFVP